MTLGYCMKCKKKVNMKGERIVPLKNKPGRKMTQGECPNCGTKVTVFLPGAKKGAGEDLADFVDGAGEECEVLGGASRRRSRKSHSGKKSRKSHKSKQSRKSRRSKRSRKSSK
jgi:hypothetical protein